MADEVVIKDFESAKAWLETQDHQTQVWFATRSVLRTLPYLGTWKNATSTGLAIAFLRASVIAAASATDPRQNVQLYDRKAQSANNKSLSYSREASEGSALAGCAYYAAIHAAEVVFSRNTSASAAACVSRADCTISKGGPFPDIDPREQAENSADAKAPNKWGILRRRATSADHLTDSWGLLKRQWEEDPADWSFWMEWYEAILEGCPLPWALTRRIALEVTEDEWDAGQAVVAVRIREIRCDFETAVAPRLTEVNGKWDVEEDVQGADEPIAFAIAQVDVALIAALGSGSANGLTETSSETLLIRSACEKYACVPSVVGTSFWNACMSLERNIGDIYPEDAALIGLRNTLYVSVEEICALDPLIRDRVARLAALETRRQPTRDEMNDLRKVPEAVKDDMTPVAHAQLTEAVEHVLNSERPPRFYRAKVVNWLNTMGRGLDAAQKTEKRLVWLRKLAGQFAGWFFDTDDDTEL